MADKQLIPNAVGRIDAITEAIRDGDIERATMLSNHEYSRLEQKERRLRAEHKKVREAKRSIHEFLRCVWADGTLWIQARRECGWKGETE